MDVENPPNPENLSAIWFKNLSSIVNKMDNTKLLMAEMKAMDSIKLDNIGLDKSETYPKEEVLPEDDLYRYIYQLGEQHGDQKRRATDFVWSENTY